MNLSIIIPVYNAENYLETCMSSILPELKNRRDVEVLLLDDGSKDNSLALLEMLQIENKCLRVFHHENHGVSYTRNRGIQNAVGKMIMFVDADDALSTGWMDKVEEGIRSNCDVAYYGKDASVGEVSKPCIVENICGMPGCRKVGMIATPWSKLYRREYLLKNGIFFDENLINGEDALFNLRVIAYAKTYQFISGSIYRYRVYPFSSTRRYNPKFYESNLYYLKNVEEILSTMKEISADKRRAYIAHSLYYSVYLYVFLVSTLNDALLRKQEIKHLQSDAMRAYYERFKGYQDSSRNNLFVAMATHTLNDAALWCMKIINCVHRKSRGNEFWREI